MNSGASWHLLLKKKNTRPCIKFGCRRPAVTIFPPFFPPSNRPVLDWTVPSGVQFVKTEMKTKDIRGSSPSPPSCSTSSSNKPPIKQEAEKSCSHAPPQRPLIPLVLLILKNQTEIKHLAISTVYKLQKQHKDLVFTIAFSLYWAVKWCNWQEAQWSRSTRKTEPDTGTAMIFPQQSAFVPNSIYYLSLYFCVGSTQIQAS